jgi:hypothetical protein
VIPVQVSQSIKEYSIRFGLLEIAAQDINDKAYVPNHVQIRRLIGTILEAT